jgi:chemotaxis protein MotB
MDESKMLRVVGLSSAVLMDKENPLNPINRRISIIVMNKRTEDSASKDGGVIEAATKAEVQQELSGAETKQP